VAAAGAVRSILRNARLRRAACWAIHYYIRFVYCTTRWSIEGSEWPQRLRAEGKAFILAFWHGRLLMIPMAWQRLAPMHMLISAHPDGQIIADAVTYFGVDSIAGSTSRGGSAALRTMLKRLKDGDCVGITPDGPRGPAMSVSIGIVNLARLAQVPILPITYATSRRRLLATWDRFHLPWPFGRGVYLWGEPIAVAPELDAGGLERTRQLIETRMVQMVELADGRVGHRSALDHRQRWLPFAYSLLTRPLAPIAIAYLAYRRRQGREDPLRSRERRGIAGAARPQGPLVWVHAASLGEATAVLGLIERLLERRAGLEVLVTTGTVTSARLLGSRLPPRARHQFVPADLPHWVARFLDHWRPDLALWVESELWPHLVLATHARGTPMVLINARLSARSYRRWQRWPGLIRPMLRAFELCLAQDPVQAERFRSLGVRHVATVGDLKAAAAALPYEEAALSQLRSWIGSRPVWLAASTHAGEEEIAADAHRRVAETHPGLLTIIVPRHPGRGDAIAAMLAAHELRTARRACGEPVARETEIYLGDTLGELGLFYRLAGIAFIGGSLVAKGGHNPFEAARLDCALLHGPDMSNCAGMAAALAAAGAAATVTSAEDLAQAVAALLAEPGLRAQRAAAAARVAAAGLGVLDAVLARLAPWLDGLAPPCDAAAPAHPLWA
jgi:3-deoxy-D-manno-octulosonic-acid transferase